MNTIFPNQKFHNVVLRDTRKNKIMKKTKVTMLEMVAANNSYSANMSDLRYVLAR